MKKIAVIPIRKGSKGVPDKNTRKLLGRPLYQWVLGESIFSELDEIYVFTDDTGVISFIENEYRWTEKVVALERSSANASDTASTESAMLELSQRIHHNYDIICLLQATSPLTTRIDINNCLSLVESEKFDSALSVVNAKQFVWSPDGCPQNYDIFNRPRRQEFGGILIENGAIYVSRKSAFLNSENRISGNIGLLRMAENQFHDIDEEHDFRVVNTLLQKQLSVPKKNIGRIQSIVFDVDGVMTDGRVLTGSSMELGKFFSMKDGLGISELAQNHITPIVLTSENSEIVQTRMDKLKIKNTVLGTRDKYTRLEYILGNLNLTRSNIAYVGDDINDLANMVSCAWSFCPLDAVDTIKYNADVVLTRPGGNCAVREAIEFVLRYNGRFHTP